MSRKEVDSSCAQETKGADLSASVERYNYSYEGSNEAEDPLIAYILNHPQFVSAIEKAGSGNGLIVEIGPYGRRTLAEIAIRYAEGLANGLVLGVDRGDYGIPNSSNGFQSVQVAELIDADRKGLLNREGLSKVLISHSIYRHPTQSNTFAISHATIEDVLHPDTTIDLVVLKFMMGYLLEDTALEAVQKTVFKRSKMIFMIDYIGRCYFTGVTIPDPQEIATSLPGMDVGYEKGENYFILWAQQNPAS